MSEHIHDLFISSDHGICAIHCRTCNNKWGIKKSVMLPVAIITHLAILGITVLAAWYASIPLAILSLVLWTWRDEMPGKVLSIAISVFRIDIERVMGDQYSFDFRAGQE